VGGVERQPAACSRQNLLHAALLSRWCRDADCSAVVSVSACWKHISNDPPPLVLAKDSVAGMIEMDDGNVSVMYLLFLFVSCWTYLANTNAHFLFCISILSFLGQQQQQASHHISHNVSHSMLFLLDQWQWMPMVSRDRFLRNPIHPPGVHFVNLFLYLYAFIYSC